MPSLFCHLTYCIRHGRSVPINVHCRTNPRDLPFTINNHGRPHNPKVLHPKQRLLLPDADCIGKPVLLIDKQPVRQRKLLPKLPVRLRTVGTDPEDLSIHFPEPGKGVAKIARLTGSAGGVVLWIEEKDYGPAAERRKRNAAPVVGFEVKIGGCVAFFHQFPSRCISSRSGCLLCPSATMYGMLNFCPEMVPMIG